MTGSLQPVTIRTCVSSRILYLTLWIFIVFLYFVLLRPSDRQNKCLDRDLVTTTGRLNLFIDNLITNLNKHYKLSL